LSFLDNPNSYVQTKLGAPFGGILEPQTLYNSDSEDEKDELKKDLP
jgi:hypothetical protein